MSQATTTTQAQQPKEHTVAHFDIPAKDPQKLSRFYEQLFGWKFSKYEGGAVDYWLINPQGSTKPDESIGGLYRRENPNEQYRNYFFVRTILAGRPLLKGCYSKIDAGHHEKVTARVE